MGTGFDGSEPKNQKAVNAVNFRRLRDMPGFVSAIPRMRECLMEISTEQALQHLTLWQHEGTTLWACFAAAEGAVGCEMRAQIIQVAKCLILKNESTTLRFDLLKAHFKFGPLQVLLTPSTLGRAGMVTHAKEGFAGKEGLHIRWESGHLLFLCEAEGPRRFTLSADALEQIPFYACSLPVKQGLVWPCYSSALWLLIDRLSLIFKQLPPPFQLAIPRILHLNPVRRGLLGHSIG